VDRGEVLVGGRLRDDERVVLEETQSLAEFQRHPDAQRVEGVVLTEPVGFEGPVVNDGGPAAHGLGGQRTA
jgi:hypothetical protein